MRCHGSDIAKGMGIGVVLGAAIGAAGAYMMKDKKQTKKTINKAIKAMGNLVDNVEYMIH